MFAFGSARLYRLGATWATLMALGTAACEDPQPPAACGTLPQVTVNAKETTTVTACFKDPNGDVLSYSATSSNPSVATVSLSGTTITVGAVAPGSASVTVAAADPGGLKGEQSFQVMVPNRAPQAKGAIPPITVPHGRTGTVNASSYFTEPDGQALTYTATSSNLGVATVSASGSTVTVTAVAKGTTTMTVTATDPGGLTATQTFQVTVPNRAPKPVGTIPDQTVNVGERVTADLSPYFTDPDGDALTYTATSSNSGVARASVSGSTLTITAVAAGSATITVTARDTEGLTATQRARVTVTRSRAGFRDDFSSSGSLKNWKLYRATAVIRNGVLELTKTTTNPFGFAARELATPVEEWTIEARMGRKTTNSLVSVFWVTGHSRYTVMSFSVGGVRVGGTDYNYTTWVWDSQSERWTLIHDASGDSKAVKEGAGELTTISLSFIDGRMKVVAGSTELYNIKASELYVAILAQVGEVWLASEGAQGRTVLFDWIDVDGDPVSDSYPADESAGDLNEMDARKADKHRPTARMLRLGAKSLEFSGVLQEVLIRSRPWPK